jgi:hypothetical protein
MATSVFQLRPLATLRRCGVHVRIPCNLRAGSLFYCNLMMQRIRRSIFLSSMRTLYGFAHVVQGFLYSAPTLPID